MSSSQNSPQSHIRSSGWVGAVIAALITSSVSVVIAVFLTNNQHKVEIELSAKTIQQLHTIMAQQSNTITELRSKQEALSAQVAARTQTEINKIRDQTDHEQKVAQAQSAEVQALLSPFTAKSLKRFVGRADGQYVTADGTTADGISLSALGTFGALAATDKGLHRLEFVATRSDPDRPRWSHPQTAAEWDRVRKAQKYLNELGQTLVELGYLAN
jgi:hypothetical protein